MPGNQYSRDYASRPRNSTALQFQTANPYAALVATAGPEHDGRSLSSGSPPSSGSSASQFVSNEDAVLPATPSRSQVQTYNSSKTAQQHYYGSPEQNRAYGFNINSTPTRTGYAARAANRDALRSTGRPSTNSAGPVPPVANYQAPQRSSLAGVPESVAVQEMAFREGQRDSGSSFDQVPTNPFAQQFNQLWAAFYKLGKECSGQRAPTPVNPSQHNFVWTVLINPYTQSLKNPNGSLDPAWTRKMITVALDCMHELIRITCRRNNGWEKLVADIPLPAQEALSAFPDLAEEYEQLKRDAREARAGGRPYGY